MGASGGAVLVLAFGIAIGGSLLLYVLVQQEHDRRQTMDRESAEQAARKDRRYRDPDMVGDADEDTDRDRERDTERDRDRDRDRPGP